MMARQVTVILLVNTFEMDSEQLILTTREGKEIYINSDDVVGIEVRP